MQQQIQPICEDMINALQKIEFQNLNYYSDFTIDCKSLTDFQTIDITQVPQHQADFDKLKKIEGPVVYWFEITSNTTNLQIRDAFENYKTNTDRRSIPASKKKFDLNSRCLYVGKVKGVFWGRMIQHLGYFTTPATQGLQLFHWAKNTDLQLRVHAVEFDRSMEDLVSIIELKMAKQLNPILGKHR